MTSRIRITDPEDDPRRRVAIQYEDTVFLIFHGAAFTPAQVHYSNVNFNYNRVLAGIRT